MSVERLYVDFHVIQTVPPSCVNRDDTGRPKTAVYGGAVRARVSSQAWKHAMREMFKNKLGTVKTGYRTRKVEDLLVKEIKQLDPNLDARALAKKAIEVAKKKKDDKDSKSEDKKAQKTKDDDKGRTKELRFLSGEQVKAWAQLVVKYHTDLEKDDVEKDAVKKYQAELTDALKGNPSADMALFGRMVADDPSLNYEAAAQVAHSISTHAVQNEYDYYSAVDDLAANTGAGYLDTAEYNSSTLYRYATVNVMELVRTLGEKQKKQVDKKQVAEIVRAFAEAFIYSMPTGKQNSYANRTLPDAVYVALREDQPVNLCNAFEKPVPKSTAGYAKPSIAALKEEAKEIYSKWTDEPKQSFTVGTGLEELAQPMKCRDMLEALSKAVEKSLT